MSIWGGKIWSGYLFENLYSSNSYGSDQINYILNMNFIDTIQDSVSKNNLTSFLPGIRYDDDKIFNENIPTIHSEYGLRTGKKITNYFLDSNIPITQPITLQPGTYTLWHEGDGTVSYSANNSPSTFTLLSETNGNCIIAGEVNKVMLSNCPYNPPYIETSNKIITTTKEYSYPAE